MVDTDQSPSAQQTSHRYAYDDPSLDAKGFLLAVMRSKHVPLSIRIKAAEGAAPYFTPCPGESRRYPCVSPHLTYIIGDNPSLRHHVPSTKDPEQTNANSQSFSHSAANSHQPQLETPGPVYTETTSNPPTLIDYSKPLSPYEIQEIKAAVHALQLDFDPSQPVPLYLCACGHWLTFRCNCVTVH